MGDRGNICLTYKGCGQVWYYTHWSGDFMPATVQKALAKRWRWDDDCYIARIIFDVLTDGAQGEETGFGIGTGPYDNEHPYVVVDLDSKCVGFMPADFNLRPTPQETTLEKCQVRWTFADYVALERSVLDETWAGVHPRRGL